MMLKRWYAAPARSWGVLIVSIWLQGYVTALHIRNAQVHSCQRGQLDRLANADGWEAAYQARSASASHESGAQRTSDLIAAARYKRIVNSLNTRLEVRNKKYRCGVLFPKPGLIG